MDDTHYISTKQLSLQTVHEIISFHKLLVLSDEARLNIQKCRDYLDTKIASDSKPINGINSEFGSQCNVKLSNKNLSKLQENLLKSHSCGTADEVPIEIVKLMLLFKIQSLSYGYSGIQLQTIERLIDFFNNDIFPVIYTQDSIGETDDLAPLAQMALPLLGEGHVYFEGEKVASSDVFKQFNWNPIELQAKEGLALLNGTQFMSAYGVYILMKATKFSYLADLIGTISLEAFDGKIEPFHELIHFIRPHKGQILTANRVKEFLDGSEIINQKKTHLQDPYCFSCIPQVHGASKDAIDYVKKVFKIEINSVTDNPTIFSESDQIISGGNFHEQPLILALDFLAISLAELAIISERRTYQLISEARKRPSFLIDNTELMSPQNMAASIVIQNEQLGTPSDLDNRASLNAQEDHVSTGANGAKKALKVMENLERILSIELMNASQTIEFSRPLESSDFIEMFLKSYGEEVPLIKEDRILHDDINKTVVFLNSFGIEDDC